MNSLLLGLTGPFLILVFVGIFTSSQARCQDNGIGVGAPKVFDNRSLEVMLQQFEESLQTAQFVDKNQLAPAIGQFQGSHQTELSRDLELTVTPTPAAAPKSTASNAQSEADKKAQSGADTTKSSASDTSSAAGMPDVVSKKYGIAAEDILSEQVNLTYQIFNLRMLLERSLSDRSFEHHPRLQSVLGFEVSLNPPKKHMGQAAVVEVRIPPMQGKPVSLVAMMPREKTYNVATLTSKVNQFGASAVAKIVNIGYTERRSGKTFFLVKDTDTFAFERNEKSPEKKGTVVFGWVFRPVLNRPAVEAGTRQVFAVIALPASDSFFEQAPNTKAPTTNIEVSTYWLPFNSKTATAKLEAKKDSVDPLYSEEVQLYSAKQLQADLSVKLSDLDWAEVGEAGALVNIYGDHLYNGTTAIVAGSVLTNPANGLLLRNDHHVQVLTTIHELAQGGEVNGRYGSPSPLEHPKIEQWKKEKGWGFYSNTWSWTPNPDRTLVNLVSRLTTKTLDSPPDLHGQKPIVTVGKQVIPPSRIGIYSHEPDAVDRVPYLQLTVDVPAESLASQTLVDIYVPFLGEDYHYVSSVYEPSRFAKVVRLREENGKVVFGIIGSRLDDAYELMIVADKTYRYDKQKPSSEFTKVSDGLLELKIDKQELSKIHQFVVSMDRKTSVIPVPAATAKPESAKPVITSPRPRVEADSSLGVSYKGTDLNAIKKVSFEGDDLKFDAAKDGTSMTIFVTRKVTGKAGLVELIGTTEDGTLVRAELQIGGSVPKTETEKK